MANVKPYVMNKKSRRKNVKGKGLTKKQRLQVQKLIEDPIELKFYDHTFSTFTMDTTPSFFDIFQPSQGTSSNQVVGAQVDLKSIQYNMRFVRVDTTNYVRMVIFQWLFDTLTDTPNWIQMFQFQSAGIPTDQNDYMSPYLCGQGKGPAFKVLKDIELNLDSDDSVVQVKGYINKGFKKRITFNDDQSPQTGVNHIYVMIVSDSGAISHPFVDGWFRARYMDG